MTFHHTAQTRSTFWLTYTGTARLNAILAEIAQDGTGLAASIALRALEAPDGNSSVREGVERDGSESGPQLTVDCVVFIGHGVVLIRRKYPPFQGQYALPGSASSNIGESVEDACRRETLEETGLSLKGLQLIGVYSRPGRDPRRHTATVAMYLGIADVEGMRAGDDAVEVEIVRDWSTVPVAFDHKIDNRRWLVAFSINEVPGLT